MSIARDFGHGYNPSRQSRLSRNVLPKLDALERPAPRGARQDGMLKRPTQACASYPQCRRMFRGQNSELARACGCELDNPPPHAISLTATQVTHTCGILAQPGKVDGIKMGRAVD
jgi:hypothetical protein